MTKCDPTQGWGAAWKMGPTIGSCSLDGLEYSTFYKDLEYKSDTGRSVKKITVSFNFKEGTSKVAVGIILTDRGDGAENIQRPLTLRFTESISANFPYFVTEQVVECVASELTSKLVAGAKKRFDVLL